MTPGGAPNVSGELPDAVAIFPLTGAIVLPFAQLPLTSSSPATWRWSRTPSARAG